MLSSEIREYVMLTLAHSGVGDFLALKGGYLLEKLCNTRGTLDIDFSIQNLALWGNLEKVLVQCGETLCKDGVIKTYVVRQPSENTSGGIKYKDADGTTVMSVDVSVADVSSGIMVVTLPIFSNGVVTQIRFPAYTIEKVLGDKISATFSQKQFRRVKDLFDIYVLISTNSVSQGSLHDQLLPYGGATYLSRANNSPFMNIAMEKWEHAWKNFRLRSIGNDLPTKKPSMRDMLGIYQVFIMGYIELELKGGRNGFWQPPTCRSRGSWHA